MLLKEPDNNDVREIGWGLPLTLEWSGGGTASNIFGEVNLETRAILKFGISDSTDRCRTAVQGCNPRAEAASAPICDTARSKSGGPTTLLWPKPLDLRLERSFDRPVRRLNGDHA
jgi:hypothetical protein